MANFCSTLCQQSFHQPGLGTNAAHMVQRGFQAAQDVVLRIGSLEILIASSGAQDLGLVIGKLSSCQGPKKENRECKVKTQSLQGPTWTNDLNS